MLTRLKRYLYLSHRWIGIVLCLFMAMWFVSGVVMMYIGYPKLTPMEKLGGLPGLAAERCHISLAQALAATGQAKSPDSVRLTSVAGAPRYIFAYGKMKIAVDAETGNRIDHVTPAQALASAASFLTTAGGHYLDSINEDAWTHSKALDEYRPLHRVQMDDEQGTLLYISNTTGEVVRDANHNERIWNWLGAWIHWLYPFRGGALDHYAADIIIYTALAGSILSLLGIAVGLLRWRFKGYYKHGAKTPYRNGWMRWHHLLGLGFGVIAFTWILSGLFSMNPWKIFDSTAAKPNLQTYMGGEISPHYFPLSVAEALARFQEAGFQAREIEWRLLNSQGYYIAFDGLGRSRILTAQANGRVFEKLGWPELQNAAERLMGQSKVVGQRVLSEYDFYYYSRAAHTMTGHIDKRLPILRLEFTDPASTWLHLDPYTGNFSTLDAGRRLSRWLFAFLHSWDWLPLLNNRPIWDILLLAFSAGGLLISVSGIVIGWQRVKRKLSTH
ncbi:PepSY domain-containing protein [Methylomonas methanica]|uniref:Sodium:proline symporter n=1 Tax=Methylomonas methanica TaxID=421 RepID=A0A177MKS1_METMH|nr:PepSY domain-containing protein [Methylomonas methanica]OAI05469.1 sodium:proline symporter [Methylomonas methanica]